MSFIKSIFVFVFLFPLVVSAQISGNAAYKKGNSLYGSERENPYRNLQQKNIIATDSTVVFNINVLLNKKADFYKITLGVSEEAPTVSGAIQGINKRIDGFTKSISQLVEKNHIFVDFITQNRVLGYDIDKEKETAKQKITGFEVKKNIIITLKNKEDIEKIILKATDFQIYDVIKVDYIDEDLQEIQKYLEKEAYGILEKKKADYFQKNKREIVGSPIITASFDYIFPSQQYQSYTVSESSSIDVFSSRYDKEYLRKENTFYYEGIHYSGFDKVLNATNPEVGTQYVLHLEAKFNVKKNQ